MANKNSSTPPSLLSSSHQNKQRDKQQEQQQRMFLSYEHWSPRYDDTFFTIKMDTYNLFDNTPPPSSSSSTSSDQVASRTSTSSSSSNNAMVETDSSSLIGGNASFPAYYYKIDIFVSPSKQPTRTIYRRYSQFKWLYEQLLSSFKKQQDNTTHTTPLEEIEFPPGTCFLYKQTTEFVQNRQLQLYEFIKDVLQRGPQFTNHIAVLQFLEL